MDDDSLKSLLKDASGRQFWLKPIGLPNEPRLYGQGEKFPEGNIEIPFAKNPAAIAEGDILIAWRTGKGKLLFVAECCRGGPLATSEAFPAQVRERWPLSHLAKNLTPKYGMLWHKYNLKLFALARAYNADHPDRQPAKLGTLMFGADKLLIDQLFAEFLICKIRNCDA